MFDRSQLPHLIRLIWPAADDTSDHATINWAAIDKMAGQHRLRPLMLVRARQDGWPVPQGLLKQWENSAQRSSMRALAQRAELMRIKRWFARAGIEAFVLKGGAICWRGWFDPRVRPMRDLDLLIDSDAAVAAYDLLRANGYAGPDSYATEGAKHLPGLVSPESGILVELHTRLIDAPTAQWAERDDYFRAAALQRAVAGNAKNGDFPTLDDADTLLHIILHGVLDHQFNNGPLLLFDILALLREGRIHWSHFWQMSEQVGAVRAAQLALKLAETVVPEVRVEWGAHAPSGLDDKLVADAAAIMLIDMEKSTSLGWTGRIVRFTRKERGQLFLHRIRNRSKGQGEDQQAGGSLTKIIRDTLSALTHRQSRDHIAKTVAVARWLR